MKRKWIKRIILSVTTFIVIMGLIIGGFVFSLINNMNTIKAIEIEDIDFSLYEDGEYFGEYYYEDQIGVQVYVTVQNGEMVEISYDNHIAGKGIKAEMISEDIIGQQSLDVDAIAGVSTSSHYIKLAIMDAFKEE